MTNGHVVELINDKISNFLEYGKALQVLSGDTTSLSPALFFYFEECLKLVKLKL